MLDNLLSGLATADADNRLATFNRSAMQITGRDGALPIGDPAAAVLQLPPAFAATLPQDLMRVRSRRTDYVFRQPNGNSIDIGLSVAALPLPDGSRGYLYTFQDVTDIRRFEQNARFKPYAIFEIGGARLDKQPTFTLNGADITDTLPNYGVTLGEDLIGQSREAAVGGGFGMVVPFRETWYFDAGLRFLSIGGDDRTNVTRLVLGGGYRF